jgi:MFS superfamily sulfate permease-like transporter
MYDDVVTRRVLAIAVMVLYIFLVMVGASVSATVRSRSHAVWGDCAAAAVGLILYLWMRRFRSQLPRNLFAAFVMAVAAMIIGLVVIAIGFGFIGAIRYCLDRWNVSPLSAAQWRRIRGLCLFAALGSAYAVIWLSGRWVERRRAEKARMQKSGDRPNPAAR